LGESSPALCALASAPVAKYLARLGLAPIARRIMLSISATVLLETFTASPLRACTVERPLRVFSDVRNTSARGGRGGGVFVFAVGPETLLLLSVGVLVPPVWCEEGAECDTYNEAPVVIVVMRRLVVIEIA
jgi:hypothetical protein